MKTIFLVFRSNSPWVLVRNTKTENLKRNADAQWGNAMSERDGLVAQNVIYIKKMSSGI